eukprot:TRINITY_DN12825_c0_g1_i1.p1 TRINITY_DN12825_c0_g1~~TRINITY_DN12825_c0_g1_i1.p1  ORF type:complete len:270 (-),score=49.07 TRINITY_DN12825_c0_g1_i1:161-970(-)
MAPTEVKDGDIITRVTQYVNEDGKTIQVTRKIKLHPTTVKVPKGVMQRRHLAKFGRVRGLPAGPEEGITRIDENLELKLAFKREETAVTKAPSALTTLGKAWKVVCRNCQENHLTFKCPYPAGGSTTAAAAAADEGSRLPSGAETADGKYVPMHLRQANRAGSDRTAATDDASREVPAIRVTNLSEETRESDLHDLFRPFGQIARIYLAKDQQTQQARGFAFVNYVYRDDAARAIEKLDGYPYDHLILHLEWAKPSGPTDRRRAPAHHE